MTQSKTLKLTLHKQTLGVHGMSQSPLQQPQGPLAVAGTNPEIGLTPEEAARYLSKFGLNRLVEEREIRFLAILREEITEPMILLLIAIGILVVAALIEVFITPKLFN